VLCRFTAFVAIDDSHIVNAGGQMHQVVQAVEAPQGWEMFESQRSVASLSDAMCYDMAEAVHCEAPPPPSAYRLGMVEAVQFKLDIASRPLVTAKAQAKQMLDGFEATATDLAAKRIDMLVAIHDDLDDLLTSIREEGFDATLVDRLEKLMDAISSMHNNRQGADIDGYWAEMIAILGEVAGKAKRTTKRKSYWK
jgi:hypothetical protein